MATAPKKGKYVVQLGRLIEGKGEAQQVVDAGGTVELDTVRGDKLVAAGVLANAVTATVAAPAAPEGQQQQTQT